MRCSAPESCSEGTRSIMDMLHDDSLMSYLDTTNEALMEWITKPECYREMMKSGFSKRSDF